ncbi:MAG: Mu transposase C-terminal domain-containing protein [Paracoccaceae bacterium]
MKLPDSRDIGAIVNLDGEKYEVCARSPSCVYLEAADGGQAAIKEERYRILRAAGHVQMPGDDLEGERIPDEKARQEQQYRLALLREVTRIRSEACEPVKVDQAISMAHERVTAPRAYAPFKKDRPSRRIYYYWKKQLSEFGVDGLLPEHHKRGNREGRCDAEFEEIVLELLEDSFLRHDRFTITGLAAKAEDLYRDRCEAEGETPGACGRESVVSILKTIPHHDIVKARLDSETARMVNLKAVHLHKVQAPLDAVEVDCGKPKIMLVDPDGNVIGRPTVCVVVDCATGWILALVVSLQAPNSELVARALKECMTTYDDAFFDRFGIENRAQLCGKPKVIISDHGPENSGDLVEMIVKNGSFEWQKCKPKHPEEKPNVERTIREVKRISQTFVGATASPLMPDRQRTERGTAEASLTVDEYERLLQKWRFDVYGNLPRKRVVSPIRSPESPYQCWNRLASKTFIPDPLAPQELDAIFFCATGERVLHRYGIEVGGVQFASGELAKILDSVGAGSSLEVKYDPSDARVIKVLNPGTGTHFAVPAKDPDLPAIGFEEIRRRRLKSPEQKRQERKARSLAYDLALEAQEIHDKKHGKRLKKKKTNDWRAARKVEITRRKHEEILGRSKEPHVFNKPIRPASQAADVKAKLARPTRVPKLIDME